MLWCFHSIVPKSPLRKWALLYVLPHEPHPNTDFPAFTVLLAVAAMTPLWLLFCASFSNEISVQTLEGRKLRVGASTLTDMVRVTLTVSRVLASSQKSMTASCRHVMCHNVGHFDFMLAWPVCVDVTLDHVCHETIPWKEKSCYSSLVCVKGTWVSLDCHALKQSREPCCPSYFWDLGHL